MTLSPAWGYDGQTKDGGAVRQLVEALTDGASGILGAGGGFAVSEQTVPDDTVKVAGGHAIVPVTSAGTYGALLVSNEGDETSPTFDPTGGAVRTDRLVLRVDGSGAAALEVIQGTPGSATPPAITGDDVLPLCRVEFPVSVSTVLDSYIVDERVWLGARGLVCTSSTRPADPFEGLRIYETDTNRELVWTGAAWQVRGDGAHIAGPVFASFTPAGNHEQSGGSLAAFTGGATTANLAVPPWASTARVLTTVAGIQAVTLVAGGGFVVRIGSVNGTEVRNDLGDATDNRVGFSWPDEIDVSGVAGTTTTIQVYSRVATGSGTIRIDTASDLRYLVWFVA